MTWFDLRRGLWGPTGEIARLQHEMNRVLEGALGTSLEVTHPELPVDVWSSDVAVLVTAEVPGVRMEDVDLTAHGRTLTITADRPAAEVPDGATYYRKECPRGRLTRTLELPFGIDPERVEASLHDGVLEVVLPRPAEEQPRKIPIRST